MKYNDKNASLNPLSVMFFNSPNCTAEMSVLLKFMCTSAEIKLSFTEYHVTKIYPQMTLENRQ